MDVGSPVQHPSAGVVPFVGRERELARLRAAVAAAAGGRLRVMLVTGLAGVGASRLVREVAAEAREDGATVVEVRCREGAGALWPWRKAVRLLDGGDHAADHVTDPADGRAVLADLLPGPGAAPRLVVLEDLHHADPASLHLLELAAAGDGRLAVLGSVREGWSPEADAVTAEIARLGHDVVALGGLDDEGLAELAVATAGPGALAWVPPLRERGDGNPAFAVEVLRSQAGRIAAGDAPEDPPLPPAVLAGFGADVARLPPRSAGVLAVAALCGREFDVATVRSAVAAEPALFTPAEVLAAVADGTRARMVEPVPRSLTRHRFRHVLQAACLAGSVGLAERTDLHRRIGEALERGGGPPAEAARHLLLAAPGTDPRPGIAAGARAADEALARDAFADAAQLYTLVLEAQLFDPEPDLVFRAELLVRLGRALMAQGRRDRALDALRSALELAPRLAAGRRDALVVAAATVFSSWPAVPDTESVDPGIRSLIESARGALPEGDSAARAVLLARLAQALRLSTETGQGAALAAEALDVARRVGDPAALVSALLARRLLTAEPDADAARLATSTEAMTLVSAGHPDRALLLFLHTADHVAVGDLSAASAAARLLDDTVRERAAPGPRWLATRTAAALALLAGRLDRADELAARALDLGTRAQHPRARVTFETQMLVLRGWRGGVEESLPWWTQAAESSVWHRAVFAALAAQCGQDAQARVAVDELVALDVRRLPRHTAWLALVAALADAVLTLELDGAVEPLRVALRPYRGRVVGPFNGVVWLGAVDAWVARLAAVAGDDVEAEMLFRDAVVLDDRLGAALPAASARAAYAAMLRRRGRTGDDARAAALVEQAVATARDRGAHRLVAQLAPGAPAAADSPLSEREREVLSLVAEGLTNKEIARRLHISPATVQRRTINLYRKIGARGRGEAAAYSVRHGISGGP